MRAKKGIAFMLTCILSLSALSACQASGGQALGGGSSSLEILYNQAEEFALVAGQSIEIPLEKEVGDKNYFFLTLETNVNLVGYIHYENADNPAQTNTEKIFIEKGAREFSSFLDAFRLGARGAFRKKISKITLQNVSEYAGSAQIKSVGISGRTYDRAAELYISDGHLKVGTSLSMGGAIRHIEKLGADVVEYVDSEGQVRVEPNVDKEKVDVITDQVNLVNIHDLGREIQQSYYSSVKAENGYAPTDEILYDARLIYNPVQAGSAGDMESQIIDFTYMETALYVKVRPLEWFFHNTLSDSYMENLYTLDESGMLYVTNRFVNFSGFTGMDKTSACTQEMPAIYIAQPLNYFYCETTEGTIFDPSLAPLPTTQAKNGLLHEVAGRYHYSLPGEKVKNDWFAFVNDNKFGIGIYMPNAQRYNASRGVPTTKYDILENKSYDKSFFNFSDRKYVPSAHVNNYNYCTAANILVMEDYVPLQYEYAIYVGNVQEMGTSFKALHDSGRMTNTTVNAWKKLS